MTDPDRQMTVAPVMREQARVGATTDLLIQIAEGGK
jgi:hypothetical protein